MPKRTKKKLSAQAKAAKKKAQNKAMREKIAAEKVMKSEACIMLNSKNLVDAGVISEEASTNNKNFKMSKDSCYVVEVNSNAVSQSSFWNKQERVNVTYASIVKAGNAEPATVPEKACGVEEAVTDYSSLVDRRNAARICPTKSLMASVNQSNTRFGASAGKQCMPACYIALAMNQIMTKSDYWTSEDMETIIMLGSHMYSKHKPANQPFFSVEDLPVQFCLKNKKLQSSRLYERSGLLESQFQSTDDKMDNVIENLQYVFQGVTTQNQGVLLTMADYTVAVIKSEDGYQVFDTHSRDTTGRPSSNGCAGLFTYSNISSIASYIIHQAELLSRNPELPYELCALTFCVTTSMPPQLCKKWCPNSNEDGSSDNSNVLDIGVSEDVNRINATVSNSLVIVSPLAVKDEPLFGEIVGERVVDMKSDVICSNKLKSTLSTKTPVTRSRRNYYQEKEEYRERVKERARQQYRKKREDLMNRYTNDSHYRNTVKLKNERRYESEKLVKKEFVNKRYKTDIEFRERQKQYVKHRYETDVEFCQKQKLCMNERYKNDIDFREKQQNAFNEKYTNNVKFREKRKQSLNNQYASNVEFREKRKQSFNSKYGNDIEFKEKRKRSFNEHYEKNVEFRKKRKMYLNEQYENNSEFREKRKRLMNEQYVTDTEFRQKALKRSGDQHLLSRKELSKIDKAIKLFQSEAKKGPNFVCCVCHRLLFEDKVKHFVSGSYEDQELCEKCVTVDYLHLSCGAHCSDDCEGKQFICSTCSEHLKKGKIPPQAIYNDMEVSKKDDLFSTLNSLEQQLIAICLPFEKLITLARTFQKKIQGPVVCVPSNVENLTNVLPRPLGESNIVAVKLKRRLVYRGYVDFQEIDIVKLAKAINRLKVMNPFYADIEVNQSWMETSDKGIEMDFSNDDLSCLVPNRCEIVGSSETAAQVNPDNIDMEDCDEVIEGNVMDSSLQPLDMEIASGDIETLSIAPAEGNKPVSLFHQENVEAKAFPSLFPDGKNTYDTVRKVKLTRCKYYNARMFSIDTRFASNAQYIFFAQYAKEYETLLSQISVSLRKEDTASKVTRQTLLNKDQLNSILKSDQGFKYFQAIRGSPEYWHKTMNELFALLRNIGLPTYFLTLSSAELSRWTCHIGAILRQQGVYKSDEEILNMEYREKCRVLKSNPVTAVRMFYHRVELFFKLILKGPSHPIGKIVDTFARVEMQARGAPHLHCLLWVEGAPKYGKDSNEDICKFIDKYIKTTLPDKDKDPELHEIVSQVQMHSKTHSASCKKGKSNKTCRFNFPKPVSDETHIVQPKDGVDKSVIEEKTKALNRLQKFLESGDSAEDNASIYSKCGFENFEDFQESLRVVAKKPSIVMRREQQDVWVNNYNPDLIRAWNANIDLQYVLDPFSCIVYIASYISKSESELGAVLKRAREEMLRQGENVNNRQAMKALGKKYFTHREICIQEAVIRLCPSLYLTQCSRVVIFIPTNKENTKMSKPLSKILSQSENDSIWMPSMQDKYFARPLTDEFETMCQASFIADFRFVYGSEVKKYENSPNFYKLQRNMGHVVRRTKGKRAAIRYTRFRVTNNPEQYYFSMLCLYLPHRKLEQLLPEPYETYEQFYKHAAVSILPTKAPMKVSDIIEMNELPFNAGCAEFDNICDSLQNSANLEDAWAIIAPNTEHDHQNQILENDEMQSNEDVVPDDIPEFDEDVQRQSSANKGIGGLCTYEFVAESIKPLLRSMNTKQKQIFYYVRDWCIKKMESRSQTDPFNLFVTGGGGVGKSHLIKCVYHTASKLLRNKESPENAAVLLLAPTGTAAHNISGHTIHNALNLPLNMNNFSKHMPLKSDKLNTLQCSLENVQIVIIDEFSMVSPVLLNYIDSRLRQIKGFSQSDESAYFGKVSVLAVGDFYQLPPVKAYSLVSPKAYPINTIFFDYFKKVELDEVMRQKDDKLFADILNRIRVKKKEESLDAEAEALLRSRVNHPDEPADALHIFATNELADNYNEKQLRQVCSKVYTVKGEDYTKIQGVIQRVDKTAKKRIESICLPAVLKIGLNCRVMLTRNLDVNLGLVNGVFGQIVGFEPRNPSESSDSSDIDTVYVVFDSEKVGKGKDMRIPEGLPSRCVPIKKVDAAVSANKQSVNRIQFPLRLGYAATVHKTQGMTVDRIVYDMDKTFAAGQAYVALSRVTTLNGLYIKNFKPEAIYRNEEIHENLSKLEVMHFDYGRRRDAHIILHNVQGLLSKVEDIGATYLEHCKVLCVTETHLGKNSNFQLEGFTKAVHCERYDNSCQGGSAIYSREKTVIEKILLPEYKRIEISMVKVSLDANKKLVVACCYRPPSLSVEYSKKCIAECIDIASSVPDIDGIIFTGDFNERLSSDDNAPIKSVFSTHNFIQRVTDPTHIRGGLLDAVYVKSVEVDVKVQPVYFSDHEPVYITLL